MNTTGAVILLVIVVLAIVAVVLFMASRQRRRSEELQGRFGPEYDRAVGEHGDRKAAESHLAEVAEQRDALDVRELSAAEQAGFVERWQLVQVDFVDSPSAAVRDADRLIGEVMRLRGYPVDDFESQADMVAADHPQVAEHYRAAHAVGSNAQSSTTEEQRRAFVHYRALFSELLERSSAQQGGDVAADDRSPAPTRSAEPPE
ncbi:MAG: hypothetical protein QOI54_3377 [Actinomycetota bacterium]|jgi:hypothetical protein|nr:hypothetical protein [Actinomycetota bacterium]